jgi:hypothetical protein
MDPSCLLLSALRGAGVQLAGGATLSMPEALGYIPCTTRDMPYGVVWHHSFWLLAWFCLAQCSLRPFCVLAVFFGVIHLLFLLGSKYPIVQVYHNLFFHSVDFGHFSWFEVRVITNKTAINILLQIFLWADFIFVRWLSQLGIAWSEGKYTILKLTEITRTFMRVMILYAHQQRVGFRLLPCSLLFCCWSLKLSPFCWEPW